MIKFNITSDTIKHLKKHLPFSWSDCLIIKTVNKEIYLFLCNLSKTGKSGSPKSNISQFRLNQKSEKDFLIVMKKQKVIKPNKLVLPIYFIPIDNYEVTISLKNKTIEFLSEQRIMKTFPIEILDQTPTPDSNYKIKYNA